MVFPKALPQAVRAPSGARKALPQALLQNTTISLYTPINYNIIAPTPAYIVNSCSAQLPQATTHTSNNS